MDYRPLVHVLRKAATDYERFDQAERARLARIARMRAEGTYHEDKPRRIATLFQAMSASGGRAMPKVGLIKRLEGSVDPLIWGDLPQPIRRHIATSTRKGPSRRKPDRREKDETQQVGGRQVDPLTMERRPGRNEPCPCQSGQKAKHCCLGGERLMAQNSLTA